MDKLKNTIFFWAFAALWGSIAVWNLFTPTQDFSESENRYLQLFPKFSVSTLLNGKYANDINTYLSDQFVGRPAWVSAQTLWEYGLGKREINSVYLGSEALLGDIAAADQQLTEKNTAGVNLFAERFGRPVYAMLVPSSTDIQRQKLPRFATGWDEKQYIADVNNGFAAGVTPVNVYDTLWQHREEYIYYRTDHHWTSNGAFLAYQQFAAASGIPAYDQNALNLTILSADFLGTFHSKTGFPLIDADKIEGYQAGNVKLYEVYDGIETKTYPSVYFAEYLSRKDKYSYFLGQVQPIVTIHTTAETGKKLIVFKDSYAHSLTPMLLASYDEIRLVDLRFINPNDLAAKLKTENYDEALFLYSTDVFSHQLGPGLFLNAYE